MAFIDQFRPNASENHAYEARVLQDAFILVSLDDYFNKQPDKALQYVINETPEPEIKEKLREAYDLFFRLHDAQYQEVKSKRALIVSQAVAIQKKVVRSPQKNPLLAKFIDALEYLPYLPENGHTGPRL